MTNKAQIKREIDALRGATFFTARTSLVGLSFLKPRSEKKEKEPSESLAIGKNGKILIIGFVLSIGFLAFTFLGPHMNLDGSKIHETDYGVKMIIDEDETPEKIKQFEKDLKAEFGG